MANISVGKMLLGAVIPGLFLSFSYCVYILVRCILQPKIAPPML